MIDLDTGQVTRVEVNVGQKESGQPSTSSGQIEPAALAKLRAAAARFWRSKPVRPDQITIIPGAYEEAYVISGSKMAAFSYAIASERYIVSATKDALSAAPD